MVSSPHFRNSESGNVVFFILLAIVLIGLVTVAMRSGSDNDHIDNETLSIEASKIREYASELERGIAFIMRDGNSESEIRFASGTASVYGDITLSSATQLYNQLGGGVEYRNVPSTISSADHWEFYGHTHLPDVGTSAPELIAVLPHVSEAFCKKINAMNGYNTATQPTDNSGDCINAADSNAALRFTSGNLFSTGGAIDETDEASFTVKPAMQGCVKCGTDFHFFHVLMAR